MSKVGIMLLLAVVCTIIAIAVVHVMFTLWDLLDGKIERMMGFPLGVLISMGAIGAVMLTPQVTWLIVTSIWYWIRTTTQNVLGHFGRTKNRA